MQNGLLIALAFLTMALFGGMDGLRGVSIPAVRADLGVSYNALGMTFFAAMASFIIAIYFAGHVVVRHGVKALLMTGLSIMAVSHLLAPLALSVVPYAIMLTMLQFGGGWLEVGLNSVGAELFTKRAAIGMSLLHLFFGLGSTLFSQFGGILIESEIGWRGSYLRALWITAPLLLAALVLRFPRPPRRGESFGHPLRAIRDPVVRRIALLLGASVMVELGIGSWMANFLVEVRGFGGARAGRYLAGFWALFTVGRLVCPFFAERFGYVRTLAFFSVGILASFAAGFLIPGFPAGLSITGIFVSILYPTVMAILMERFPGRASQYMSPVLIIAISTATISSWAYAGLHDLLGEYFGFLSVGMTPLLILAALRAVYLTAPQSFSSSSSEKSTSSA